MDTRKIGAPTRKELLAMIAERMDRKDTDGNALYLLRRGLRSLELFVTPDTVGGDLAMDICAAIDEIERIAKLEKALDMVQEALASYRDGNKVLVDHPEHGPITTIEEVKYLVVDPLLQTLKA